MRSLISVVIFSNTDNTDLRDISLTLVIGICEIPDICGYIFSNTDNTDLRDVSLALGMSICGIPNICGYIFRTQITQI